MLRLLGVGKIAVEEVGATNLLAKEAGELTKNISKMGEAEILAVSSEGTIVKNIEGAASTVQPEVSKIGEVVVEGGSSTATVVTPKKGIIQNTGDVLEKIKKYEGHIFSPDHKNSGILTAGESQEAIMNSIYDIIISLDKKGLLVEGPNQIKATIGGIQNMEIKCFIQNGEVWSVNAYPSKFGRIYANFIDSTKVPL